jgi:hypothetical protein
MTPTLYTPTNISGHLAVVHDTYRRWFGPTYDITALNCVLSTAAAEKLTGDPPWLLIVGGAGAAKTETISPLIQAGATGVSTISGEAALLSGTSRKDRSKDATGGLLRKVGSSGIVVIKDVTSILSMNRDTRALVLAALREIYDGRWGRNVGTDGGHTITWNGRLVVIGAVTTAWDSAHAVISVMGDRFLLVRIDSSQNRQEASRQAMANVTHETTMRAELGEVVAALLKTIDAAAHITVNDEEMIDLLNVADLVTRSRTAVERDFQGNPMYAHALEMPTRVTKQLVQVVRGGIAIGLPRPDALTTAMRCAQDSIPPLRLKALKKVAANPGLGASKVAQLVEQPRKTVHRTLLELQLLGLLTDGEGPVYSLVEEDKVPRLALDALARFVTTTIEGRKAA